MVLAFASGAVGRGGSTDVAIIIVAVLIIVPGISAANAPLLQTRKFHDGSLCLALSVLFRHTSCFFFSEVVSLIAILSYENFSEFANE